MAGIESTNPEGVCEREWIVCGSPANSTGVFYTIISLVCTACLVKWLYFRIQPSVLTRKWVSGLQGHKQLRKMHIIICSWTYCAYSRLNIKIESTSYALQLNSLGSGFARRKLIFLFLQDALNWCHNHKTTTIVNNDIFHFIFLFNATEESAFRSSCIYKNNVTKKIKKK